MVHRLMWSLIFVFAFMDTLVVAFVFYALTRS